MIHAARGLLVSAFLLTVVCPSSIFAQGNLTPPGAPAPTMKTLSQIEARIPITNAGYAVGQSGSYYLTRNLHATNGQDGIIVSADNVTIDMNGFTLTGSGTNSGHGIVQVLPYYSLRVYNGKVFFWRGPSKAGIYAQGENNQFDHIEATDNSDGIVAMNNAIVSDCAASFNKGDGIYVGEGSRLTDCVASQNGSFGLYLNSGCSISGCSANKNGYMGIYSVGGSSIINCAARENDDYGIYVGAGCSLSGCSAVHNKGDGFYVGSGSTLANCESSQNLTNGFVVYSDCFLQGCIARNNGYQGFYVSDNGNTLLNCIANYNTSSGIFVFEDNNRIEGNHMTGNDYGLYFRWWGSADQAENNFAIHNTAIRNTTANYFYIGTTNNIGPIETYGSFASPWANFSY